MKPYDRLEYYIFDNEGRPVEGIKSMYDAVNCEIIAEGLHEGEYVLLVLGIKGNPALDDATVHKLENISGKWISFGEKFNGILESEYYYSRTPFRVEVRTGENGTQEIVSIQREITQKRIFGKAECRFSYRNDYVRSAMVSKRIHIENLQSYTSFSADSMFSDIRHFQEISSEINDSLYFMPFAENMEGKIEMASKSYRGKNIVQHYDFKNARIVPNGITAIPVDVNHPDDNLGIIFLTEQAYEERNFGKILQDEENKIIYANPDMRKFNTMNLLQHSFTDEGKLHLRFYSPKEVRGMTVRILPDGMDEYVDLAFIETVPAFADIFIEVEGLERNAFYYTESGRLVKLNRFTVEDLKNAKIKLSSEDEYWKKLQEIKTDWTVSFSLFSSDPDLPDGGVNGNWMGIRPVHCREVIAIFINFTYMVNMPEHIRILEENKDILYGNGGVNDKITPEKVLEQMRAPKWLSVGLVYPGNGIIGLGSPSVWGVYENAYLTHYTNTYACEVMFHELGHVMNYNHDSAFTYGPWAQELMNNFYVNNLHKMPVDSEKYLNSKNNPNIYEVR